jgi:hypothetical protein
VRLEVEGGIVSEGCNEQAQVDLDASEKEELVKSNVTRLVGGQSPRNGEASFEVISAVEPIGVIDPESIQSDFDFGEAYTEGEGDQTPAVVAANSGIMGIKMEKILGRIRDELSKHFHAFSVPWLTEYLRKHGWWIRKDGLPYIAKELGFKLTQLDHYYLRDISIWLPDLEGECMPHCVTCLFFQ